MPEMGESVTEGIVLEWHVAEGDFVNEGDTVVEVSTDKVDAEVPAPMDGVITKLLVAVDDEVPVGRRWLRWSLARARGIERSAAGPVAGRGRLRRAALRVLEAPPPRHPRAERWSCRGTAANGGAGRPGDARCAAGLLRLMASTLAR